MRELAEQIYFQLCRATGRLLRSARYSRTRIVVKDGELSVKKNRLFYAPLLVQMGAPINRLLDTGVTVLSQQDWANRERLLYQSLRGTSIGMHGGGTLLLPCLPGKTLASLLEEAQLDESVRKQAIELAVVALAELH